MKIELKERIRCINRREVPEGYHMTNTGIVPRDWKPTLLVDCGAFFKGYGIQKSDVVNKGINCVRYGEIYTSHDYIIKKFYSFINDDTAKTSFRIIKGDILFACSGETKEDIGKSVAYLGEEEAYAGGDIIILRPYKDDSYFLAYLLNSYSVNKQRYEFGEGHSVVHIYSDELKKIHISLPELTEQIKITSVLSTWDKAIELKEKLIEHKKEQKKGLMQKLLKGEIKLPGFDGEWRKTRIGDLVKEINRQEKWDNEKLYDLVSIRRRSEGLFHRDSLYGHQIATKNLVPIKEGDFLISKMQVVHGALGEVKKDFDGYYVSGSYIILNSKDDKKFNIRYFHYLSNLPFMYRKALESSYGVHIEKMTFNLRLYLKEKIYIPIDIDEQNKIVQILDHLIRVIVLLEKELEALKLQKKGLMQLLLTGIVRVIS